MASNSPARSGRKYSRAPGTGACSHSIPGSSSKVARNGSCSNGCPPVTTRTRVRRPSCMLSAARSLALENRLETRLGGLQEPLDVGLGVSGREEPVVPRVDDHPPLEHGGGERPG